MKEQLNKKMIEDYRQYLELEEKSRATIEKYVRDISKFYDFLPEDKQAARSRVLEFKEWLIHYYKPASVNSMLIAVNGFLNWLGLAHCRVRGMNIQRPVFCREDQELSKDEYKALVRTARKNNKQKLCLIMQTICATGIRVSELPFITAEALQRRQAVVNNKNKLRVILLSGKLCTMLERYVKQQGIKTGPVFITKNEKPLSRSYIWEEMKRICRDAQVNPEKVFPHNLRHLFARTYYEKQRDITKLADILGHSSIETTRLYTISSGREHAVQLERLDLTINC